MGQHGHREGFTLVETLVVVSTTALLLGLLLPSLQTARQQAQKTACLSNLRQMAIAAHGYASAYDEHYPLAYSTRLEGGVVRSYSWDYITWKVWSGTTGTTHVEPGLPDHREGPAMSRLQRSQQHHGRPVYRIQL